MSVRDSLFRLNHILLFISTEYIVVNFLLPLFCPFIQETSHFISCKIVGTHFELTAGFSLPVIKIFQEGTLSGVNLIEYAVAIIPGAASGFPVIWDEVNTQLLSLHIQLVVV